MEKVSQKLKEKLALLPDKPGVYLMKNKSGTVIYIGKAKVLKNRVKSYFTGSFSDRKTKKLVRNIDIFDYFVTSTEKQALVLENNLIKKYKPHYNIMLKDDKQYPFIKITWNEPFPRVYITRTIEKDKSKYYGPYTDVKTIRKTMRLLEWIFPYRTCKRNIPENQIIWDRSCINYQLGKCPAPCIGKISKKDYRRTISQIVHFLKGRNEIVVQHFQAKMNESAQKLDYEEAASFRDKIANIKRLNRYQNMYFTDLKNRDVIGIYKEENKAGIAILKILSGKLLNKEMYLMENLENEEKSEILEAFLTQYYTSKLTNLPSQIILPIDPSNLDSLNELFKNKLIIPQRGELRSLQLIAQENAYHYVEEDKLKYLRKSNRTIFPVKELKDNLKLNKLPRKMICFDISTIQGIDTVASMVFFENGKPKKKNYRHFIIQSVAGQDDFASMREALSRYLNKLDDNERPDLIVIDGGKGQLSSANKMLKESKREIEIISLAKRLEEVFIPNHNNSVLLSKSSAALRLLIQIRDEAHRFAITFHRKRRKIRMLSSELDDIKGIGEETKFMLLKKFGSVDNIRHASKEELAAVKGIGSKTAMQIHESLNTR